MKSEIYRYLGKIFYRLNGGLEGLHKKNWLYNLTMELWARAYHEAEKDAGRL